MAPLSLIEKINYFLSQFIKLYVILLYIKFNDKTKKKHFSAILMRKKKKKRKRNFSGKN